MASFCIRQIYLRKILGAGHTQQETYVVFRNSLVVCDPLIFSNLSDAKTGHQYVVLFFELSYNEWTLEHKLMFYEKIDVLKVETQ